MDFKSFAAELQEYNFFDDAIVDIKEKEMFGHFTVNGLDKALFQLWIREEGNRLKTTLTYPDLISQVFTDMTGNLVSFLMKAKENFEKGYTIEWEPSIYDTGIRCICIKNGLITSFNSIIVEMNKELDILEKAPFLRYCTFYFALKTDKKWKHRLSLFMDNSVPRKEKKVLSIDFYNYVDVRKSRHVKASTRKSHVLKDLGWNVPYVIEGEHGIDFIIIKLDDSGKIGIEIFVMLFLHILKSFAGVPVPGKEDVYNICYRVASSILPDDAPPDSRE
jgi:hypothetical protein